MKEKCKLCEEETENRFNIDFKAVPICEGCATAVFIQQAMWYAKGKTTAPKTHVAVIAQSVEHFRKWIKKLEERHPNEFKFKMQTGRTFLNEKTNTEYICMSTPNHPKGYAIDNIIEADWARMNNDFDKILETLQPCLTTKK